MATVTHYIYSHYDPPEKKDATPLQEMAEEDESEEDAIKRAIEMSMKGNDDQQKK